MHAFLFSPSLLHPCSICQGVAVYVNQQEKFDYTVNHTDAIQQLRTCMPLATTHMHMLQW